MVRARVISEWVRHPKAKRYNFPALALDYPGALVDVTGQPAANIPTDPALVVFEGVWDDAAFAALLDDPKYGEKAILESDREKPKEEQPTEKEVTDVKALLVDAGVATDKVEKIFTKDVKSRAEFGDQIITWASALPRKA